MLLILDRDLLRIIDFLMTTVEVVSVLYCGLGFLLASVLGSEYFSITSEFYFERHPATQVGVSKTDPDHKNMI